MESSAEMSPWEGLENARVYHYKGIQNLKELVKSQSAALMDGHTNQQYVVFTGVTEGDLENIDQRASIGRYTRLSHYTESKLLVIKLMPLVAHEAAHANLSRYLDRALWQMGLPDKSFFAVGTGRVSRPGSFKEGDAAFKPLPSREKETDWPTIVFESGVSESLKRLRHDARWWLEKSDGNVKIVIIISIRERQKSLHLEKWRLAPALGNRPATRARPNPKSETPTKIQEITIVQTPAAAQPGTIPTYNVTGAPVILEFDKLLLRPPVPPNETDVVFSVADLESWADFFWSGIK